MTPNASPTRCGDAMNITEKLARALTAALPYVQKAAVTPNTPANEIINSAAMQLVRDALVEYRLTCVEHMVIRVNGEAAVNALTDYLQGWRCRRSGRGWYLVQATVNRATVVKLIEELGIRARIL